MKFLLDQSTDARIIPYLTQLGHDATQIHRTYPHSIPDTEVLSLAYQEKRILITGDRDFGELVFRLQQPHAGVIFLRLGTYAPLDIKIERLSFVLTNSSLSKRKAFELAPANKPTPPVFLPLALPYRFCRA